MLFRQMHLELLSLGGSLAAGWRQDSSGHKQSLYFIGSFPYNGPRKLDTKTTSFKLQSDHEKRTLTRPENPDRTGNAQGDEERL